MPDAHPRSYAFFFFDTAFPCHSFRPPVAAVYPRTPAANIVLSDARVFGNHSLHFSITSASSLESDADTVLRITSRFFEPRSHPRYAGLACDRAAPPGPVLRPARHHDPDCAALGSNCAFYIGLRLGSRRQRYASVSSMTSTRGVVEMPHSTQVLMRRTHRWH